MCSTLSPAALWLRAAPGQSHAGPLPPLTSAQLATAGRLQADVTFLAQGPRDVTHQTHLKASADHIVAELTRAGYQPRRLPYQARQYPVENLEVVLPGTTRAAEVVVMPSLYESLSMIVLEAWLMGKPVLVNGRCDVLRYQCRQSNGGLYYNNPAEFAAALRTLLAAPDLRAALGRQGRAFAETRYHWDHIVDVYRRILQTPPPDLHHPTCEG